MAVPVTPRFRYISLTRLGLASPRVNSTATVWRSDNIVARRRFGSTSSRVSPSALFHRGRYRMWRKTNVTESWRCCTLESIVQVCKPVSIVVSYLSIQGIMNSRELNRIFSRLFRLSSFVNYKINKQDEGRFPSRDRSSSRVARVACVHTPYDPSRSWSSK